ncbi:MAG: DUF429 domain-containing protein [Woeseiaceae bacterium]|nr:DUF429 domain-containing protein [Woeseiaceae bacterium]
MGRSTTVYGIDFTSAPSARKPITCVRAQFDGRMLAFEELLLLNDFDSFEQLLATPGEWVAGMDFPFGQPRRLVENIGWPLSWAGYVREVSSFDRRGFRQALEDYKRDRPPGDKHHKRQCDVLTRSQSPQTLYGTPVGLMFFEGAPRLLNSGVHLPYHHDGDTSRVVLEAYPGVAARRLIGETSYKNDSKAKQTAEQRQARQQLLRELTGKTGQGVYGFSIDAPKHLVDDPGADALDALICAVQAAWGQACSRANYGAPESVDRLEGWIADPSLRAS